jgi:hypothetical protein
MKVKAQSLFFLHQEIAEADICFAATKKSSAEAEEAEEAEEFASPLLRVDDILDAEAEQALVQQQTYLLEAIAAVTKRMPCPASIYLRFCYR